MSTSLTTAAARRRLRPRLRTGLPLRRVRTRTSRRSRSGPCCHSGRSNLDRSNLAGPWRSAARAVPAELCSIFQILDRVANFIPTNNVPAIKRGHSEKKKISSNVLTLQQPLCNGEIPLFRTYRTQWSGGTTPPMRLLHLGRPRCRSAVSPRQVLRERRRGSTTAPSPPTSPRRS